MKIVLKSGKTINVSASLGNKSAPWTPCGENYRITISVYGKRASFDFWDSYQSMIDGKDCDLRGAAACFAGDAITGINSDSADDIAKEFGYDAPSEAYRVFRGCKKTQKQAERLGLSEDDLSELYDY